TTHDRARPLPAARKKRFRAHRGGFISRTADEQARASTHKSLRLVVLWDARVAPRRWHRFRGLQRRIPQRKKPQRGRADGARGRIESARDGVRSAPCCGEKPSTYLRARFADTLWNPCMAPRPCAAREIVASGRAA